MRLARSPCPSRWTAAAASALGASTRQKTFPRRKIDPVLLERDAVVGLVVQVDLVGLFQRLEREPLRSLLVDVQIERHGTPPSVHSNCFAKHL
jgi:hypothetical protein